MQIPDDLSLAAVHLSWPVDMHHVPGSLWCAIGGSWCSQAQREWHGTTTHTAACQPNQHEDKARAGLVRQVILSHLFSLYVYSSLGERKHLFKSIIAPKVHWVFGYLIW